MDELGLAKSTEADEETMPRSATPKHAQRHAEPPAMPVRQQPDDWSAKPVGPGWDGGEEHETHGALAALVNPRVPSVTATMNLNLEAYYIGATVAGFMAGQRRQPDIEWGTNYCMQFGEVLAKKVRKKYGL
jgi:hypothetical protein